MATKAKKDVSEREIQMTPEQWDLIKALEGKAGVAQRVVQAALQAVLAGHGITDAEMVGSDAETKTLTVRVK